MKKNASLKAAALWAAAAFLVIGGLAASGMPAFGGQTRGRDIPGLSPLRRSGDYRHFLNLCLSIRHTERSLAVYRRQIANNANPAARRRFRALIFKTLGHRQSLIRRYDRAARRAGDAATFRASGLPYALSPSARTRCHVSARDVADAGD